ncbi:MAG: arsinothricin resistance N-acetyltransferase ArsN1 family A, partial [Stappiaceae bacterium]
AAAIAGIYNQGIEDRIATFETEPRSEAAIRDWLKSERPAIVVVENNGPPVAFALASSYRDRPCYSGIYEFSVYTRRDKRGFGYGRMAMDRLIETARDNGAWKLVSRIFPENTSSRALCAALGFREVGTYERHGKLNGQWRDTVIVEKLIDEENRQADG